MAKLEHKNLFFLAEDRREVYETLQRDFNRDTYLHAFWGAVFVFAAIGGVLWSGHNEWIWLFLGLYGMERMLSRWIDNSNRNWAMHVIDWMERERTDRIGR